MVLQSHRWAVCFLGVSVALLLGVLGLTLTPASPPMTAASGWSFWNPFWWTECLALLVLIVGPAVASKGSLCASFETIQQDVHVEPRAENRSERSLESIVSTFAFNYVCLCILTPNFKLNSTVAAHPVGVWPPEPIRRLKVMKGWVHNFH